MAASELHTNTALHYRTHSALRDRTRGAFRELQETDKKEAKIVFVDTLAGKGDMSLVTAAKQGNREAFEILVERSRRKVLAVVLRFTSLREDAEDIVQESFHKAFVHLHRFEAKSSFSTWLARIAINEALMLLRRSRGVREVSIDSLNGDVETASGPEFPDSAPDPESNYLQRERKRILSAAMNQLTPRIRKAIELRDLRELSTEETARVMGLTVQAVKGRLFHARRKLRQKLKCYVESAWVSEKHTCRAKKGLTPRCANLRQLELSASALSSRRSPVQEKDLQSRLGA